VSYVDAGYAIALVVLAVYALSLLQRRRRLERAAAAAVTRSGSAARGATRGHEPVRVDEAPARDPLR
jgi:uncharacterized protein (TIGR03382 family)